MFLKKGWIRVFSLLCIVFLFLGFTGISKRKMDKVIEEGKVLQEAFASYYKDHGAYPDKIMELKPYLDGKVKYIKIPFIEFENEAFIKVKKYMVFVRIFDNSRSLSISDRYRYGYEIVYFPYISLIIKRWLIYNPSETYVDRCYELVKKRYRGWAVVERYRTDGELNRILTEEESKKNLYEIQRNDIPYDCWYYKHRFKRDEKWW